MTAFQPLCMHALKPIQKTQKQMSQPLRRLVLHHALGDLLMSHLLNADMLYGDAGHDDLDPLRHPQISNWLDKLIDM